MPTSVINFSVTGRINRRDMVTELDDNAVLSRENMLVVGSNKKFVKKVPGSSRLTATAVGTSFTSGIRYYNKSGTRKTFSFNSDGYLYYIDDNGNTTALTGMGIFNQNSIPTFVNFRVSDNDILYFMEGVNTGMYSHDGNIGNVFKKETAVALNFVDAIEHLDRLWGIEDNSEDVNFSKNLSPTNFTDSTDAGVIIVSPKRGSKLMRIIKHNETLYFLKQDGIFVLEGNTPNTFAIREVHPYLGTSARHSVCNVQNGFAFLGSDYEVYLSGGTQESTKMITYDIALDGDLTKDITAIINKGKLGSVRSCFHNNLYRMAFTEVGQVQNRMEYIFNTINETDLFTRGANISCYIKYDLSPDELELITGRSDVGRIMYQYRGLNWDNDAAGATMPLKIQSGFKQIPDEPRNFRVRRYWADWGVLGARPVSIRMRIDTHNANSDTTSDNMTVQGETNAITNFVTINAQDAVTSRQIPRHANSRCRNFSLLIDEDIADRDVQFSKFYAEIISKHLKRSQRVGL